MIIVQNQHRGSTLDSFLEQDGTLGELRAQAISEVITWQSLKTMKDCTLNVKD